MFEMILYKCSERRGLHFTPHSIPCSPHLFIGDKIMNDEIFALLLKLSDEDLKIILSLMQEILSCYQ